MLAVNSAGDSVSARSSLKGKVRRRLISSFCRSLRLHVSQAHLKPGQAQYKASSAVLMTGELLTGNQRDFRKADPPFVLFVRRIGQIDHLRFTRTPRHAERTSNFTRSTASFTDSRALQDSFRRRPLLRSHHSSSLHLRRSSSSLSQSTRISPSTKKFRQRFKPSNSRRNARYGGTTFERWTTHETPRIQNSRFVSMASQTHLSKIDGEIEKVREGYGDGEGTGTFSEKDSGRSSYVGQEEEDGSTQNVGRGYLWFGLVEDVCSCDSFRSTEQLDVSFSLLFFAIRTET